MTAAVASLSTKQALKMWDLLRQHLINAGRVIEEIIEQKAWEPLGYETFAEAWTAQMADLTIAKEIRPHVVYQLLADGLTADEASSVVKGLGAAAAESLQRQRRNGVPAGSASMSVVSRHLRNKPSPAHTLRLELGAERLADYRVTAKSLGETVEDIAIRAIEERFRELSGQ